MMIDRENRVKLVRNIGQYVADNAEELVPKEIEGLKAQCLFLRLDVESKVPAVRVISSYEPSRTIYKDIKFFSD